MNLPPISHETLHAVAIAGCLFLVIWWLFHLRSGRYGFTLTCIGCTVILAATFGYTGELAGVGSFVKAAVLPTAITVAVIIFLAMSLMALLNRRMAAIRAARRGQSFHGRCPRCNQLGTLMEYEVPLGKRGRQYMQMCNDCGAREPGARLV